MVVASLLLLLLVVAAFIWQGQRSRVTFFPPGKTNGYVILIQAARALTGPDPSTLKTNLQEAAALNQPSLNLMRQALAFDAECPPHLYADPIQYSREIQALRQLSLLAQCEGRLFEQNGEWNKAAVTYIDVIRFGRSVEHGPSASLHLGLATQSSAILSLSNVAHA